MGDPEEGVQCSDKAGGLDREGRGAREQERQSQWAQRAGWLPGGGGSRRLGSRGPCKETEGPGTSLHRAMSFDV